jgi:hypothetical protein
MEFARVDKKKKPELSVIYVWYVRFKTAISCHLKDKFRRLVTTD